MTPEYISKIAGDAGANRYFLDHAVTTFTNDALERFVYLIAEKTREAIESIKGTK